MIKKILCAALITATVASFASCGCSPSPEPTRPPESVAVTPRTDTAQYASFVTKYKWINEETGDTIDFRDNGTFSGKIDKKDYSGTFTLKADKEQPGIVYSQVVLDGKKKKHDWTFEFKDSAHMTLKTDKNVKSEKKSKKKDKDKDKNKEKISESYAAEWTIESKETKAE